MSDQLTLGRPDQVAVIFARRVNRRTPGRFHTKVIYAASLCSLLRAADFEVKELIECRPDPPGG